MKRSPVNFQEKAAAAAFSRQAPLFDQLFGADPAIRYKRKRVRDHMLGFLQPSSQILELNAGTGEDAIFFARLGHQVHATDIAGGMQEVLRNKVKEAGLENLVTNELCSFTELENLSAQGPYDHIFSNFAGLNCTGQLEKVLDSFSYLLKPGGHVTLVMLPRFCLWEFLLLFKGKFRTAFRRFTGHKGTNAHIEGTIFRCWYYNPSYIRKQLSESFDLVELEGLCCLVPPSYIQGFSVKYPGVSQFLERKENALRHKWPWKSIGDYYIMTLRKRN